jgi:hypothetical protein
MKIQKTEPTKTFQPISITITIESEEELKAIESMIHFDETIPELVGPSNSKGHLIIQRFLQSIAHVL